MISKRKGNKRAKKVGDGRHLRLYVKNVYFFNNKRRCEIPDPLKDVVILYNMICNGKQ